MARINVYLPDDLARRVKGAGINVSKVAQEALRAALGDAQTNRWLDDVARLPATKVAHDEVLRAVEAARRELGASDG
ncbi:MAG: type II toxin-antitoxin system CcdA family antitoxin [Acidimicrobiia bacterium]|nr:type II toxin-antitoxin system CcdA family antitoxin [Acidimicrobiia bacterium]